MDFVSARNHQKCKITNLQLLPTGRLLRICTHQSDSSLRLKHNLLSLGIISHVSRRLDESRLDLFTAEDTTPRRIRTATVLPHRNADPSTRAYYLYEPTFSKRWFGPNHLLHVAIMSASNTMFSTSQDLAELSDEALLEKGARVLEEMEQINANSTIQAFASARGDKSEASSLEAALATRARLQQLSIECTALIEEKRRREA